MNSTSPHCARASSLALALLFTLCFAAEAAAHQRSRVKVELTLDQRGAPALSLDLHADDLGALIDPRGHLLGEPLPKGEALEQEVSERLGGWLAVDADGDRCALAMSTLERSGVNGWSVGASAPCEATDTITLTWTTPEDLDAPIQLDVTVRPAEGAPLAGVLNTRTPSMRVDLGPGASQWDTAWNFFVSGIEHILTGWDHLAFLLALVLACGTMRRLLIMVSGFTVSHSITLCLGAFDVVRISPDIVEPIIAASIALAAGVELYRLRCGELDYPGGGASGETSLRAELAMCLGFGLVHGLGFAGMLAEAMGATSAPLVPIFTFNLGVEVGQVFCVALAFPILSWVGRSRHGRAAFLVVLAALVALGVGVTIARVAG